MRSQDRRSFVRSLTWSLAAIIAALFTLSVPSAARAGPGEDAPRPGRIVGVVLDTSRQPVAGAAVSIVDRAGHVIRRMRTNEEGRFAFAPIHPGQWMVRAEKRGVGAGREAVAVRPGETARTRIVLR